MATTMSEKKTSKKKVIPTFEIELLPSQKEVAHKRLGCYGIPNLMSYARSYMKESGKLFGMEGYFFVYASLEEIDKISEDHGLIAFKHWAQKNCTVHGNYYGHCGLERHVVYQWLRFPDGLWVLQGNNGNWMTWDRRPGKKGIENDPKGDAEKSNDVDVQFLDGFDVKQLDRFKQISLEFPNAWRVAREKYRDELKTSGKAKTLGEHEANKTHVKRTKIRMAVLNQASTLRDKLDVYIKSVTDETMTVKQIGELYEELTNLGALNKTMKKVYGSKMAKK